MDATLLPFFWPVGAGTEPPGPPPDGLEVLGHDGTAYLVVQADGKVRSIDPSSPLGTRFVNSTAGQFAASLGALAARQAELQRSGSGEALLAVSSLRHDLNHADIKALGDRTNWWAVVLDRMEDALP